MIAEFRLDTESKRTHKHIRRRPDTFVHIFNFMSYTMNLNRLFWIRNRHQKPHAMPLYAQLHKDDMPPYARSKATPEREPRGIRNKKQEATKKSQPAPTMSCCARLCSYAAMLE